MEVNKHYYGERGLINCLIDWFTKKPTGNKVIRFLSEIIYADSKKLVINEEIKKADIYNEFSFGEFGDPDLIIRIETENEKNTTEEKPKVYIFIIEAKTDTFEKSREKQEYDDTKKQVLLQYKGHASDIDIQLLLRRRFIFVLNKCKGEFKSIEAEEKKYKKVRDKKVCEGYTYKDINVRALKKEKLIEWAKNNLKEEENKDYIYKYIAITNDNSVDNVNYLYQHYINMDNCQQPDDVDKDSTLIDCKDFGMITWKMIIKKFKIRGMSQTCRRTFEANNPYPSNK